MLLLQGGEPVSGIQWTVVRPAGLTNNPVTDKEILVREGEHHVAGAAGRIARADVARFMLDCVDKEQYHNKGVSIAV